MLSADISTESRILKWVRENGLPTLEEVQARIDAARALTPGQRGRPQWTAETILWALVAREWRAAGFTVAEVATGLAKDPQRNHDGRETAALEQRLKRNEAALRRLEAAEGTPTPRSPRADPEVQQARIAHDREGRLWAEFHRLSARAARAGIDPDCEPRTVRAEAQALRAQATNIRKFQALYARLDVARGLSPTTEAEAEDLEALARGRVLRAEIIDEFTEVRPSSTDRKSEHQSRMERMRG